MSPPSASRPARRAVVFAPAWPDHDRASGSQRTLDLVDLLRECGWEVTFVARHGLGEARHARALHDRGVATLAGFGHATWRAVSDARPQLGLCVYWPTAEDCLAHLRRASPATRVLVDSVDLHFVRRARQRFAPWRAPSAPGALDAADGVEVARELNVYAQADGVLTVSAEEAALLERLLGGATPVFSVPDCEELPLCRLGFQARRGAVFIGNFRHPPNVEAAERLCRDVVPRLPASVRAQHPVRIVGHGPPPSLLALARSQDVLVAGFVPSVRPYLEQARVALVPLRHGAGTKRKLIQAVLLGTPVVSTRLGLEGLPLQDGQGVVVADDDRGIAAATTRLLTDEAAWTTLAGAGRPALVQAHGRETVRARLREALDTVAGRAPKVDGDPGPALRLPVPQAPAPDPPVEVFEEDVWAAPEDLAALLRTSVRRRADRLDVVVLAGVGWADGFARPQQMARHLAAAGHRVFFIEPVAGGGRRVYPAAPDLMVAAVPPERGRALADISRLRAWLAIHEAVLKVDDARWRGTAVELRRRFGWPLVHDAAAQGGAKGEGDQLARESDLVLVASAAAVRAGARRARRVVVLADGADVEHVREPVSPPRELRERPRPIVAWLDPAHELDVRSIARAAELRPQWTFLLLGHASPAASRRLRRRPNVLFADPPYRMLPGYLRAVDVGAMGRLPAPGAPVRRLLEYLAAGVPVVAPPLPQLRPAARKGLLATAADGNALVRQVERLLLQDGAAARARRAAFAERHSWTARVAALAPRLRGLFAPASIVVVTHNNLAVTRRCLESLFACTAWPAYEVVVVDNGSTDGTVGYLRDLARRDDRVRALFGRRNLGFAPAANRGLRAARGRYLVLLNNDTVLTPGWLGGLLAHLGDPGVGAVGPVSNWASGPSQVEVEYRTLDEMCAFAARYTSAHAQDAVQTDRLAMFCLALPRSVYDEIGPLDERFELGMFEDDDYARRIRATGRRLLSVGDVFVHHVGHATFSALGAGVYDQAFAANRERFEEKWTTRWTVPAPRAGGR